MEMDDEDGDGASEARLMRIHLRSAQANIRKCIACVIAIAGLATAWYSLLGLLAWAQERAAYGTATITLGIDAFVIGLLRHLVVAAPHRVNGRSSRRYVKLAKSYRIQHAQKGIFSDEADAAGGLLAERLTQDAKARAEAQLKNEEPHGCIYACLYVLQCWCCRKRAKVRPGGKKRWSVLDEPATKRLIERLSLDEKIAERLLKLFKTIDKDRGGTIGMEEFNAYFRLPRTPFSDRAFSAVDRDGSKAIDFREFAAAIYNFCSLTKSGLMIFAFLLYDADMSKSLDRGELALMLRDVWGEHWEANPRAMYLLAKLDADNSGDVSLQEWILACKKHPMLLAPAFKIQSALRQRSFGDQYWEKRSKSRSQSVEGQVASIMDFIKTSVVAIPQSSKTLREKEELDQQMQSLLKADHAKQSRVEESKENVRKAKARKRKLERER
eukprot:g898.t1